MAAPAFVLLHSPLVGPGSWTKVAERLCEQGFDTVVPRLSSAFNGSGPYYPKLVGLIAGGIEIAAPQGDLIVVAHSAAGALLPAVARDVPSVAGAIFVDALLPHPGQTWFETVPPPFKAHLLALAHDGHVPRWHEWWPSGSIEKTLANPARYETFVSGLTELPLSFFEEAAPEVPMRADVRCAYMQWSPACRMDAERAAAEGWTVMRRPAHHLSMLTNPDEVASDLVMLSATLGVGAA